MRQTRRLAGSLLLTLLLAVIPATVQPQEANTAGTRLGSIIKSAIETALPAAGQIVDLIWSKIPRPDNRIDRAQLTSAVASARLDLFSSANAKIAPVTDVVSQLNIVNQYLEPAVEATHTTSMMLGALSTASVLKGSDWATLATQWKVSKNFLASIGTGNAGAIPDLWLRDKLGKISNISKELIPYIDADISQQRRTPLIQHLQDLQSRLSDVSAAVGYQLSDLQGHLDALAKWARGAQSASPAPLSRIQIKFMQRVETDLLRTRPTR